MATLKQQLQKATILNRNFVIAEMFRIIRELERVFVEKNVNQINVDSTDIYGEALGFYSRATEYITTNQALLGGDKEIKYAGDPYTGKDTGDWLDGYYMKLENGVLRFGSTDPKNDAIVAGEHWLTTQFFGLTDENLREVIEQSILPFFITAMRKQLDL